MNSKVDDFIENTNKWQDEFKKLRSIILDCGLIEELKWGQPCYTYNDKNIILLGGFKAFCIISFLKGALLKDENGLLKKQGENTRAGRIIPFTSLKEIVKLELILKSYIFEAIEIEKIGLKVDFKNDSELKIPTELQLKFKNNSALEKAFYKLTPGKRRGYIIYFTGAKQSKTIESRIDKYTDRILGGKGFYDCICGMSKKMPKCDGSDKYIK